MSSWVLFCRIEQLNISWCGFNKDHVKSVVSNVSPRVVSLNISGYRESLTLDGKPWKPDSIGRGLLHQFYIRSAFEEKFD